MIPMMMLLRQRGDAPPGISVDYVSAVLTNQGSCSGSGWSTAVVTVSWGATGFDGMDHEFKVYKNGVDLFPLDDITGLSETINVSDQLVADGAPALAYVDVLIAGSFFWTASWTLRVDLVRRSDGFVMSSKATTYTNIFGKCGGPGEEPV